MSQNPRGKKTPPTPRNNNNRAENTGKAAASRDNQVVELLNQLGDRMIRSEKERLTVKTTLQRYDSLFAEMENRLEQINATQADQIEKLARAEALTLRIEETIAQQARLTRRIEKMTHEKMRMISKLDRIEETVLETRAALNAPDFVAMDITAGAAATPALPAQKREQAKDPVAQWWNRPFYFQAAGVTALIVIAAVSAWTLGMISYETAPVTQTAHVENILPVEETTVAATAAETEQAEAPPLPGLDLTDQEMVESFENDPEALAAALNALEPEALPAPQQDMAAASQEIPAPPPASEAVPAPSTPATSGTQSFLDQQKASTTLAQRINPDPALPAVVKEIEKKAFAGAAEAQHDLAAIYTAGHGGVKIDYTRAAAWFKEAALQGIGNARYNLGVLYHQGLGVEKNVDTAIGWYRAAAESGHPEAQYNLGIAYVEGIGTGYNPQQAAQNFEKAAKSGIVEAAYNLGLIYENGLLGEAAPRDALYWYKMAADKGNPEAKTALQQLSKSLNMAPQDVDALFQDKQSAEPPVRKEKSSGLPVTGTTKTAAQSPANNTQAVIAQIQEQLIRLGIYPGPANGISNPLTEDSVRSYQGMNGLERTGIASEDLLAHMMTNERKATIAPGGLNDSDMVSPERIGAKD